MLQTISAMFIRALRGHFRNRSFAWARAAFAIVVLLVLLPMALPSSHQARGLWFLSWLFGLNVVSIFLATGGFFASAITEEKEEGTLPLLLMAGASPLAVLLGKTAARILEGLLLLVIQLPFAMLAVTLGGVMLEQVFAGYTALAGFLFFCACMAALGSVIARRHAFATVLAFAGIAFAVVAIPALGRNLPRSLSGNGLASAMGSFPIWSRLDDILDLAFSGKVAGPEFFLTVTLGLVLFALAWFLFVRFPDGFGESANDGLSPKLTRPDARKRPEFTGALVVEWKDRNFVHGGARKQRLKVWLYYGAVVVIAFAVSNSWSAFISGIGVVAICVGTTAMIVEMCVAATRMYRSEIYEKTLSTLLTVPFLTIEGVDSAKLSAAKDAYAVSARMAGIGVVYSFLVTPFTVESTPVIAGLFLASIALPMVFVAASPALLVYCILLRNMLVRCSLNMAWGAVPTAIGITFAAVFAITVVVSLIVGFLEFYAFGFSFFAFLGPFIALIPIWYLSARVRKGNIARLYELAAEER